MLEPLDEPLVLIALDERPDESACQLQALEAMQVHARFLERAVEPLDRPLQAGLPTYHGEIVIPSGVPR